MITTQWAIAVPAAGVIIGGVMRILGSAIEPEAASAGIVVHSLTFTNDPEPAIYQHRTVTAQNALTARWAAEIRLNGKPLEYCSGNGTWDYPAGEKTPRIQIDEWVGRDGCWDRLPAGVPLQGCAKYTWGDGQVAAQCTLGFRKANG